jgi:capsular polysaccharide biosynthesis protein
MEYKEIKLTIILVSVVTVLSTGFEFNITKKQYSKETQKVNLTETTTYSLKIQNIKKENIENIEKIKK